MVTPSKDQRMRETASIESLHRFLAAGLLRLRPAYLASFLKKLLLFRRTTITTSHGNFFVDIASNIGFPLFAAGIYEPHMIEVITACLRPGGVFVDLGANEGYFSVIASNIVGRAGRVVAIEPQLRLQPVISKNLSLNNCKNVRLLPLAISDDSRPLTLHLSPDMNTGSTAAIQTTRYALPKQEVLSMTLAELFRNENIASCDLLKIDIEGYEYEAILGSRELFESNRIKVIALELHPQALAIRNLSADEITQFLASCGYELDKSFSNTVFVSQRQHSRMSGPAAITQSN